MIVLLVLACASISAAENADPFTRSIRALEERHGGRIGVAALDTADRRLLSHRGDEKFAMCSTFKFPLAAAVAARIDAGEERWDRKITYGEKDLLTHAPVARKPENLRAGAITVEDCCAASIQWSDNTTANLLLATIGGPAGLTRHFRSLGDASSRLDRIEPALNENRDDDPRDTTTPEAMVTTMEKILLGGSLSPESRKRLADWLVDNRTGDKRLRAAMDPKWKTGDKTGTGENGAVNDIAIVWPGGDKPPWLIAVYYTGSKATPEQREKVVAEAGGIVRRSFQASH